MSLRQSDVLTTNLLAMKAHLVDEFAEDLLADMVNEGILDVIIVVGCTNEEYQHFQTFYSFEEFYRAKNDMMCNECGESLDFKKVKVGFRRGNY